MSDRVYVGPNAADLDYDEKAPKITRVNLSVDSDHIYTSGDDTGRTLEVSCPWGTQAMADSILAKVSSVEYRPYEASDVLLDPAAEIGDGITIGGIYSVLAQSSISLDKQCAANISAPYTDEIDDEYPYKTPEQRKSERQLAYAYSLITKTAEQIRLEVANEVEGLSASIDIQLDSITSQVTGLSGQVSTLKQTADSITTRVEGLEGSYSSLEQYVDSLTLSVSNGTTSSKITLKAGNVTVASEQIILSGLVTYAEDGSPTFVNMKSDGLYLYHTDVEAPKATLTTDSAGSIVQLILGAGSTTISATQGRFFVQKETDRAGLYYYSSTTNDIVGFTFMDDGTITVHGSMPVTAVFK